MRWIRDSRECTRPAGAFRIKKRRKYPARELKNAQDVDFMVELSGIEPLASSLRIQRVDSDGAKPKNTK